MSGLNLGMYGKYSVVDDWDPHSYGEWNLHPPPHPPVTATE